MNLEGKIVFVSSAKSSTHHRKQQNTHHFRGGGYVMSPFRAIQTLGDMKEQFEVWDDVAALDMACRAIQYCRNNQLKQRI